MFGKPKTTIKLGGCSPEINEEVLKRITSGNLAMNYLMVRKYCDSLTSADNVCEQLISLGFKIQYEGKEYSQWVS